MFKGCFKNVLRMLIRRPFWPVGVLESFVSPSGGNRAYVCLRDRFRGVFPGNRGHIPGNPGTVPGSLGQNPGNLGQNPGHLGPFPGNPGPFPGNLGPFPPLFPEIRLFPLPVPGNPAPSQQPHPQASTLQPETHQIPWPLGWPLEPLALGPAC